LLSCVIISIIYDEVSLSRSPNHSHEIVVPSRLETLKLIKMNKLQILADACESKYSSQLLDILNIKNINHSLKILECETLKDAHEYCLVNRLSGQQTGPLIEKFIIDKGGMRISSCIRSK